MTPYEQARWQHALRKMETRRLKAQLDWSLALNVVLIVALYVLAFAGAGQ